MATTPQDGLIVLRDKIAKQRITVAALKRDGHDYADAEGQLNQMVEDLRIREDASRHA